MGTQGTRTTITGTVNGGTVFVPLRFSTVTSFIISVGAGADNVDINAVFAATGLQNFTHNAGTGDDMLDLNISNYALPVAGGAFTYNGGDDTERVVAAADVSYTLSDASLTSTGGGSVQLTAIENANLTGGVSANQFLVTNWSGIVRLFGLSGDDKFVIDNSIKVPTSVTVNGGDGNDSLFVIATTAADTLVLHTKDAKGNGSLDGLSPTFDFFETELVELDSLSGNNSLTYIDDTNRVWGTASRPEDGIVFRPTGAASGEIVVNQGKAYPLVRFKNINSDFTINGDGDGSGDFDTVTVLGTSTTGVQSAGFWNELTSADGKDDVTVSDSMVSINNAVLGQLRTMNLGKTNGSRTIDTLLVRSGNEVGRFGDTVTVAPSALVNILLDAMDPVNGYPGDRLFVDIVGTRTISKSKDPLRGPNHVRITQDSDGASVGFWNFESIVGTDLAVTGTGAGIAAEVQPYDVNSKRLRYPALRPFGGFTGGVTVASADVNKDGIADIIVGAGPGGGPHVRIYDGIDGSELSSFYAYNPGFTGGVFVAGGDTNQDGYADIIVGAGGGPHVRVMDGKSGVQIKAFFAYAQSFSGCIRVSAGDGISDIILGAGFGGGPHVRVLSGSDLKKLRSFFTYAPNFEGGVFVSAGDLNGDFISDIITGAGIGGGPHVRAWDGSSMNEIASFMVNDPFSPTAIAQVPLETGISVSAVDLDADGVKDIVTAKAQGTRAYLRGFRTTKYDRALKKNFTVPLEQTLMHRVYGEEYGWGLYVG